MDGFGDEQHTTDWSFDGVYTRYHNHSYTNGDRWSSTNTSEFPPINRPRLVKIVTFWLTLILIGLICVIIYLAHIRETKTRYYISHGKLAILQEYTTALGHKDSMEYKSLTANFCNQMDKTFRKSRSYTNNYRMCVVTNLRPGSVIVTFTLYFDATVDVSDNAVLTAINDSVQQVDSKHMLGDYPIDINGLSVTTTLTLYEQDPLPFLEPNSDFIIPPTTKQTTTSTAVTSTSTIPATITTAIPPADTTETKQTTTSSTETTKVTTVMTQPTTETTKSTTTMPMTTTVETTTESHTKASTSTNTILLTSTTEPKTTTTLPSTVTTELTTTIPLTPTTEGTMISHKSPTTTMTSTTLALTVTTKSTNTIALPMTTQDTKTTTLVPTITTEATTSTTLPPSSTTKATTTIPLTSSTEAKTTTTKSLITTVATTSMSPTTTEAKTTTTLSPSTTTKQTTTTITPTVTFEVTTRATGLPVVATEESREELTTKSPAKPTETTVSPTLTTNKTATTISSNITSNRSTTIPVKETTEALTTIPPTKTTGAEVSTTLPTTVTTKVVTGMSSTLTDNKTTLSLQETTGTTTITMSSPEITEGVTTIPTSKTTETTVSNTLPTTKEDTTISTNTTSNTSTTLPVKETTEALTTIPSTKTTEAEVSTTLPTTVTTRIVTSMSSTITGNKTTLSIKETTGTTTITMSSPETPEGFTSKTTETTVSSILLTTKEDTSISTNKTFNTSTISPIKETTEALTTIPPTKTAEATMSAALQTTKEAPTMSPTIASNTSTTFSLEETTEALTTIPPTKTTEAEVSTILPTAVTTKVVTSMSPTITGNSTTTFSLIETTGTLTSLPTFMSTKSRGTSTMSEIITTLQSVPTSTNTDISVKSTFTTFESTSVSVENNTLSTNDTTVPPDNSAKSSPDSTTTVETSIISHKVSDNATAEPTVLPTSDISTLISTEETTLTNTTREDTTETTVSNTTSDDTTQATFTNTTREVTTEATTASTTVAAAVTNTTREDITTALVTNTTEEVTIENNITNTTSEYTTEVTLNTTREYTTETTVTNTTLEDTIETTVVNTSEYTSGTSTIATTVSPFTADVMFPSKTIFAREDTTLECVIIVTDQWEKVTMNQETENDILFLAEFYNNGSVFSQVTSEFLTVVFKQDNETIKTIININIQYMSSCPSLLYFACGIIMEDTFKSVITNTSTLSITAPLHNVTLDMATVYYSGERLELICRTITDFEYGEVALEVQSPSGLVHREPAPRNKYESTRNSDCSVEFEWSFKSNIFLTSSLNGSTVRCIASNRLLNTSVSTSQLITVLVSDVSFSQYYVPGSVGKQVTIECKTNTLTSNIAKMAVYKTFNGTNETIASYSSGHTNSSSDVSVTFQGGVLTLKFLSLKCSDEGLYICVVTSGSLEVSSPLSLTLQPTVLAGSTAVSLSLNTDIVENYYRYTSEHSCFGEVGYPDAGFLSLNAIHPTSGDTVVYNEEVVTDAMKVKDTDVASNIYNYGVTLAKDFRILVREDRKVQENCSTIHKVRFFLNVSREWSMGIFRCEVRTKEGRIPTSVKEEQFYVIPSDVCDAYNETKQIFIDHEKNDNCNSYIECGGEAPLGGKCDNPKHCAFIGKNSCDECVRAICTEIPTTTARPVPTTEALRGFSYLDCYSSSVNKGESANISCHLNSSSFVSLNISKSDFTIASIQVDGSVIVSPNYQGKLSAILILPSLLLDVTIYSVTCSDDGIYNVTLQLDSGNVTSTTFKVNMKVKPKNPTLTLNPNLVDGENSLSHSCTGNVGYPPGSLQIQIRRSTDSNFTEYSTRRQIKSSTLVNAGNCSYIKTLNFSIDLTTDSWSNVTIRCVALNSVSLKDRDPVPNSIHYTRTSISSEFCENKTATYYDYHPMGCPFYVWCVTGQPYGQVCGANSLCINPASGGCV